MNGSVEPSPEMPAPGLRATVIRALPNGLYTVRGPKGQTLTAHVAGTMRVQKVRLLPGDVVALQVSPLDPGRARITGRILDAPDQGRPTF